MKRFVWRLQKVLDVKIKEEQLRRTELLQIVEQLAARHGELLLRQRMLQDLMAEIQGDWLLFRSGKRCQSPFPEKGTGTFSEAEKVPVPLNAQEFFLRHAATDDAEIRRLREEIAALEIRRQEKTAEVLAVRRFKEGLEKLRAQAREEYLREQEKLEQKEQDERTTIAFARQGSGRQDR